MPESDRIDRFLPLNPRRLMVLLSFAQGRAHGYEIRKRAEEQSRGEVQLDAGSLYRILAGFLDDGLIREAASISATDTDDTRRRYYELTALGRQVLEAETGRLAGLVEFARTWKVLGEPEGAR